jgi:hypothetical protein
MKMRCKEISAFVFAIFLLSVVSANFEFSKNESFIATQYEINNSLNAKLNISFFNENLSSTFTDSLGHSITLREILSRDTSYTYIFYDVDNTSVSAAYQLLDLGKANFNISAPLGNLNYTLKFRGSTLFGKTFQVMSVKSLIENTLNIRSSQLNSTKIEVAKYPIQIQNILNRYLNITSIEGKLQNINTQYTNALTNAEYSSIAENLSLIKIPVEVAQAMNTSSISFYPARENIDLNKVIDVAGGSYGQDEDEYIDSVYSWNAENLKTDLTFNEIIIIYSSGEQKILRIFQFQFDKSKLTKNAYFFIEAMDNLRFEDIPASQIKGEAGYSYINLNDAPDKIVFSTTEDVDFLNVPVFISPAINDLTPAKVGNYERWMDNTRSKWILFIIIAVIVFLIGVVTYILLQMWYRRKYEAHLFKNRNNLFNIMNYIQNAKKKETPRDEIIKNLKKAGWTGEQIDYALRKYENKKIIGIINRPLNITETGAEKFPEKTSSPAFRPANPIQKKPEMNPRPGFKPSNSVNSNPGVEKKPGEDTNQK